MANILYNRISSKVDPKLRNEQAGFRPNRSCIDQINSLRIIVEQSRELNSPLYLCFVDFQKAFDTLAHTAIWKALQEIGIPSKIINIIKELYKGANSRILHKGKFSDPVLLRNGVKQGCILSPLLFNIVLDNVMKKANNTNRGITWGLTGRLEDLDYADDICLLAHTYKDMYQKLKRLASEAEKVGLRININKTKEMRMNTTNTQDFTINGQNIKRVRKFVYLGSVIDDEGGTEQDVQERLNKARRAYGTLNNIWRSGIYSISTKIRIFNTNVKSVLLYGCESWKMTKTIANKLQVFINRALRRICHIFWPNRISNEDLWSRTNQESVIKQIKRRKWGCRRITLLEDP